MSGKEKLLTDSRLEDFKNELDEQIKALLPIKNPVDETIVEALNMTYDQIKNIHPEECSILCYKLAQYSTYIQTIYNRYKNIRRWSENNLNKMTGKYGKNYGDKFTKFEEKKYAMIAEDNFAEALNNIWIKYSSLEEELFEISNKIRYISQTIQEVKNVR